MGKKEKKLCNLCPSHQHFLVCSEAIFYLQEQTLITAEQCFKIQSPSLVQVQENKFNSHAGRFLFLPQVDSTCHPSTQPFPLISIKCQHQHSWSIPALILQNSVNNSIMNSADVSVLHVTGNLSALALR